MNKGKFFCALVAFLVLFITSCKTVQYPAVATDTQEPMYYKLGNEYRALYILKDLSKIYYLDEDGKKRIYVDRNDPNVLKESQKWEQEQGSMKMVVTPTEIYQESNNNKFTISLEYNLMAEEAKLIVFLKSAGANIQEIENKIISRSNEKLTYTVDANIDIKQPYLVIAYFQEKNGDRIFAGRQQSITVKEPEYMFHPISTESEMQEIMQKNITLATQRAENDFNNYGATYAIPHLTLQQLLISITSGSLQQIFASSYPLPISQDCNAKIEDWQYISRRQFENAVFILAYMETVDKLQRRSNY